MSGQFFALTMSNIVPLHSTFQVYRYDLGLLSYVVELYYVHDEPDDDHLRAADDDGGHDRHCHDYLGNGSVDTPITPGCRRTLRRHTTSH